MKNFAGLIICSLLIISCNQTHEQTGRASMHKTGSSVADSTRDGIFVHLTESYNDPHRVLMPLKMAVMMAEDKDVIVYMDIHAVELLVKGAKDLNYAGFESAHSYIKELIGKKVGVYACPTCLKIAGYKPEDLIEGVQIAQKDKFLDFTRGRIVTLDY